MKTSFQKINDQAFSNLLRAQFGRPGGSPSDCPEFDPDLANAYVEHSLTAAIHIRFERHLSECTLCRTSVVALARMHEADTVPLQLRDNATARSIEPAWLASIKAAFSAPASSRWTAAAVAVVVIAFVIPLLVWQSGQFRTPVSEPVARMAAPDQPAPAAPDSSSARGLSNSEGYYSRPEQEEARAGSQARVPAAKAKGTGELQSVAADAPPKKDMNELARQVGQTAPEASDKKAEAGNVEAAADESSSQARAEKQTGGGGVPARERSEESKGLSKINQADALKVPADEKPPVVTDLRPGKFDPGPRTERERVAATITSRDAEAPKTKSTEDRVPGSLAARRGGTRALVDSDTARADRARSPQKKLLKKTFWLSKGIWTDADYDPTDDLPIVTVVRHSDVYKEMLEKKNKLSSFLTSFGEGDRAIIVYKSTVYKLIPHPDSK